MLKEIVEPAGATYDIRKVNPCAHPVVPLVNTATRSGFDHPVISRVVFRAMACLSLSCVSIFKRARRPPPPGAVSQ